MFIFVPCCDSWHFFSLKLSPFKNKNKEEDGVPYSGQKIQSFETWYTHNLARSQVCGKLELSYFSLPASRAGTINGIGVFFLFVSVCVSLFPPTQKQISPMIPIQ